MTIAYADGRTLEAVLLARTDNTLRVAVKNADDVLVFSDVNGTWVSEDCEPVRIEFAWQLHSREAAVAEADCICPKELASRLMHLLFSGSNEEKLKEKILPESPPSSHGAPYHAYRQFQGGFEPTGQVENTGAERRTGATVRT